MRYACLFMPLSIIYSFIISLRSLFYNTGIFKEYKLNAKVISVGNITWGGTGKTPAVLYLQKRLREQGRKVAILIRGYGRDESEFLSRMAHGVPVMVGKDRFRNGQDAISQYSVDTILLDDGFQHRRVKRDLDIVCIDATNPFGNGYLIPAGSMREHISGLKRAHVFLLTKTDLVLDQKVLQSLQDRLERINPDALIVRSIHKISNFYHFSDNAPVDIGQIKDKELVLVSAIGNPYSFERTILNAGLRFKKHFIFRDHHWYSEKDLENIEAYCAKNKIDAVVCTEKDAIKLRTANHPSSSSRPLLTKGVTWFDPAHHKSLRTGESRITNIVVLSVALEITQNNHAFTNRLFRIYNS